MREEEQTHDEREREREINVLKANIYTYNHTQTGTVRTSIIFTEYSGYCTRSTFMFGDKISALACNIRATSRSFLRYRFASLLGIGKISSRSYGRDRVFDLLLGSFCKRDIESYGLCHFYKSISSFLHDCTSGGFGIFRDTLEFSIGHVCEKIRTCTSVTPTYLTRTHKYQHQNRPTQRDARSFSNRQS